MKSKIHKLIKNNRNLVSKNLFLILCISLFTLSSYAQEKEVSGTVTTANDGLPLPGASVIVKGTSKGVNTDFEGKYTITVKLGDILVVSFVGMETAEVTIGEGNTYDVILEEVHNLEEVVVVGYSKTTKQSFTGTASVVSHNRSPSRAQLKRQAKKAYHDKLASQVQSNNVKQTLRGEVKGVNVITRSGTPGFTSEVRIRGYGSINGNSQPLYVIDGQPVSDSAMQSIDPSNISSMTVLKDASATSIYGSRGANGVILISTKNQKVTKSKPLYIVDGRPINAANNHVIESIPESDIDSKIVYEGSEAKDKFGKIAKHGCVVITTRQGNFRFENESYAVIHENNFESTATSPLSTFSIDVDKASYSNIRRMINSGTYIEPDAVKIEEMVNYFNYNYPQPTDKHPFSIHTEVTKTPWHYQTQLVRIGIQGKTYTNEELPASNLTFLIDVSGSMSSQNKLPLLKNAFKLLVNQLREKDKVSIVVYAGAAGVILEPTSGHKKDKILKALDRLEAGGSTAGGQGIKLAYKLAEKHFKKNGNNRVILATDGDFNVGPSSDKAMEKLIEEKRKSGVFLSVLGFGYGNYKDSKLEILADKGNGNHAYIDNMQEAQKVFGKEFGGTLYTIAKDVKIQVEFNPKKVQGYRLIGYENRLLNDEDFVDDTKDAGELGSGHTVTALYEVVPFGVETKYLKDTPNLKYTQTENSNTYNDELFTVKFRYKKPDGEKSIEMVHIQNTEVSAPSVDMNFAAAVALYGMKLRHSKYDNNANLSQVIELAEHGRGEDKEGYRAEFLRLVKAYHYIQ
ncbi:YfbK domain-containing protein [Winogradskyella aquimaris]|uniref:von Willebrand factor type A domain-containing protein n=1 Tax=Winogradskyella aquimaris TaxID=864074 RepID=A0ABU5EPC3_9FLAO|nr:von Willebrand factor type A domain-containing protein [Winogradskyella aquimaris]MDY2588306.1 von Willebrand factor type A domain-containing protein [Winogradskyella aquimaris]